MTEVIVLVLLGAAIVGLIWEVRDLRKKVRAERVRADAEAADAQRSRARAVIAEEHRSRAVLRNGEVLEEVAAVAEFLRTNHLPLVAARLDRLANTPLGTSRRQRA
ncbi:hypothetical protein E1287_07140 [Actinomadura sp. KC06]|uniref:hypothetical protein n=1 Tax=Actinomadura sp. KC06 TaxID=2530369 RepID=UPI00104A549F|nr:hypothetical protein [Actinomadura sp. KC06]TDD37828.1 hypothetical protein E1287_07140 [Actinomadura sp. KC06]